MNDGNNIKCKLYHCDHIGSCQCCAVCVERSKCKRRNLCLNDPSRCGVSREPTEKEIRLDKRRMKI